MTHSSQIVGGSGQPLTKAVRTPTQRQRRRASEKLKGSVYAQVDAREGNCCRLTGKAWNLEHHHILARSQGGKHCTENVVLLHREQHRDITEKRLTVEGDADDVLIFTRRDGTTIFSPVRIRV